MSAPLRVAIAGLGTVGAAVADILISRRDLIAADPFRSGAWRLSTRPFRGARFPAAARARAAGSSQGGVCGESMSELAAATAAAGEPWTGEAAELVARLVALTPAPITQTLGFADSILSFY